ncbi:uncharacterized protein N7482_000958 [Penicillium canariense]|uniref:Uncharacterized protein n=1 Tax=Penicillium canariense TaxID=189055 RepID=A0A9W9IGA5_9EURO|nr:uncharacterized protein N7482_000958 [Penicillium canariense]KAJ5175081.1 hypothetical protein N7482_000958 [Penicillium canariense]
MLLKYKGVIEVIRTGAASIDRRNLSRTRVRLLSVRSEMAKGGPRKRIYTDLATVLILLSTFAGAVTLQTQFTLPDTCNGARARALVAYASQFFLASPIAIFAIFMSLHGYEENDIIEAGRHEFIQCQFGLTGIMIIAGFLLLNITTLYTGGNYLGPAGIALTGIFILATVAWGIEDHLPPPTQNGQGKTEADADAEHSAGSPDSAPAELPQRQRQFGDHTATVAEFLGYAGPSLSKTRLAMRWTICGLVVLEAAGVLVLFGLGIAQAVNASPEGCQLL